MSTEATSSTVKNKFESKIDFKNLNDRSALIKILKFYNAFRDEHVKANQSELALLVSKVFHDTTVTSDTIVDQFTNRYFHSTADQSNPKKRIRYSREHIDTTPARIGEQVAAKFTRYDENGSWVLGNVTDYDANADIYNVQDEDDVTKIYQLHSSDVRRLDENQSHLRKGDQVLAVFPETTSFYRATVAKKTTYDIIVRFEDDEDHTGKCPPKRVPSRFILTEDDDEYEEIVVEN